MTLPAGMPAPKFHTERDESRPTLGPRQALFSRVWLGTELLPWQRLVADVSGELVQDDETGLWVPARSLTVCTVQRQGGKSHLLMAVNGERCFSIRNFRSWYTAQTGADARDQFLKFADDVVFGTPLAAATRTLRGAGREVMQFANKSTIRPYAPTEGGLHGKQVDRNDIDEGWAFPEDRGRALMQGSGPAALTRPAEQTGVWSAGGTADSTWLAGLVARGRAGDPDIAYFEWGIPDDLKIEGELSDDDYREIASYHPAVGHTITVAALKKLRTKIPDDAEYARAAGNRWTEVIGGAVDANVWARGRYADPIPEGVKLGYGAATSADRTETAIVVAARVGELIVGEVLQIIHQPYGAATLVAGWATDGPVAVDRQGPSASLADALTTDTAANVMDIGTREATAAAASLLDGLNAGFVKYRQHPALDAAAKVVVKRSTQDGAFLWARSSASASIAAFEAFGLAAYAVGHRAAPLPAPRMRVPGE